MSISDVDSSGSMWVTLKRVSLGAKMRIHTWKWTLIAGAWSDRHWRLRRQSSAWWSLRLACWYVLVAFLPKWFAKWYSTHQSCNLGFSWSSWYFSSMAPQTWYNSPVGSNLQSLGPMILFNEPRTVRLYSSPAWRAPSWWKMKPRLPAWLQCHVVPSSSCSMGPFPSLYLHLSTKNGSFRNHRHTQFTHFYSFLTVYVFRPRYCCHVSGFVLSVTCVRRLQCCCSHSLYLLLLSNDAK